MEQVIRTYIKGCNDAEAISACFCADAAHYFFDHDKWQGAAAIGRNFAQYVHERGRFWTVDQVLTDADRCAAVMEWTVFHRQPSRLIRGMDWFVFDRDTLRIREVRFCVAAPARPEIVRQELRDFDYAGRGYPTLEHPPAFGA
jgi:hypothetical protein